MDAPRPARPTINFIDEYCAFYRNLFMRCAHATRTEFRSFEAFKHLHLEIFSSIKRKILPAIALIAGLPNEQSLHHFLTKSHWQANQLRNRRLALTLSSLKNRKLFVIIDEMEIKRKEKLQTTLAVNTLAS
jgi:SRSO17 transposase